MMCFWWQLLLKQPARKLRFHLWLNRGFVHFRIAGKLESNSFFLHRRPSSLLSRYEFG